MFANVIYFVAMFARVSTFPFTWNKIEYKIGYNDYPRNRMTPSVWTLGNCKNYKHTLFFFGGSLGDYHGIEYMSDELVALNCQGNTWSLFPNIYKSSFKWPSARYLSASWVSTVDDTTRDTSLLLFGGYGIDPIKNDHTKKIALSDVWEYSLENSQWTWLQDGREQRRNCVDGNILCLSALKNQRDSAGLMSLY